jgi:DNA-binding NarL/FixJ family response regulator
LLADAHETILARVRTVLGDDFEIVGAVGNGYDAVSETQRLDPDVLIIDICMPALDGLQAARRLQSQNARARLVFLTVHEDPDFVSAAFSAGASAYVAKSRATTDLVPAVRAAVEGQRYISQSIPT